MVFFGLPPQRALTEKATSTPPFFHSNETIFVGAVINSSQNEPEPSRELLDSQYEEAVNTRLFPLTMILLDIPPTGEVLLPPPLSLPPSIFSPLFFPPPPPPPSPSPFLFPDNSFPYSH